MQRGLMGKKASTGNTNKISTVQNTQAQHLDKLVKYLLSAFLDRDPTFVPSFLRVYRSFATTKQLLDRVFTRYGCIFAYEGGDGEPENYVKKAISSFLGLWINLYPEDFVEPPGFFSLLRLLAYLKLNFPGSDLECQAQSLLSDLQRCCGPESAPEEDEETSEDVTPTRVSSPEPEQAPGPAVTEQEKAGDPSAAM